MKKSKIILFVFVCMFLLYFGINFISYLLPGKISIVDDFRMPVQKKVMNSVGNYAVGKWYYESETYLKKEEVETYFEKLRPGDVFFTSGNYYASSFFIDGKWKHSVIFIGKEKDIINLFGVDSCEYKFLKPYYESGISYLIIDSTEEGVLVRDLYDVSDMNYESHVNSIIAFRVNHQENIDEIINYAISGIGKEYDYDLILDEDSLYCSELVYFSLLNSKINVTEKSDSFSREIILPNDIVNYIVEIGINNDEFSFLFYIESKDNVLREYSFDEITLDL